MSKIAFVFPGQGSQAVGMLKDVYAASEDAKKMIDEGNEALGFSLSNLMFEGPAEDLTLTYHAQPALLTASAVLLNELTKEGIKPDYVAGHSLGEYSALVAAGSISYIDGVKTVHTRGQLMNKAVPAGEGTMAAVLGLDAEELEKVTAEISDNGDVVQLANINCPGQIVISGTVAGVEKAGALAKERGAKRVLPLNVSGPFHSALMKPAAEEFKNVLANITISNASVPVVANVTAEPMTEAKEISERLVEQLYSPVRFHESVERMLNDGVDTFIEIGAGKVLSGLVKKVNRRATVHAVYDMESLQKTVQSLKDGE
jgi:[acyl-carrier-protein] S-malonyltransferase